MDQRKRSLQELDDDQLLRKHKDAQQCVISSKTEEQAERYNEQMIYITKLIDERKELVENLNTKPLREVPQQIALGKMFQKITTGHEGDE